MSKKVGNEEPLNAAKLLEEDRVFHEYNDMIEMIREREYPMLQGALDMED